MLMPHADLSDDAVILYSSDSIVDVLGHTPDEVVGKKAWDFFHPSDVGLAQAVHKRSNEMDKASVLVYCDIKNRNGQLVRCECAFSIVYNVIVACTSIYKDSDAGASKSCQTKYIAQLVNSPPERRAEAPIVRRRFASSPKDPRYHMLQHLSARFRQNASDQGPEPRAALFLNRFTRTLTIMYATSGIEKIVGISSEDMKGRSFYYCIAEASLEEAVRVLESAKGNDSIAYIRFMFRDPRQSDEPIEDEMTEESDLTDAEMTDAGVSETEEATPNVDLSPSNGTTDAPTSGSASMSISSPSGASSAAAEPLSIELEAVVSCTSDGLVVVLRRARPHVPPQIHDVKPAVPVQQKAYTGYFAAPWGMQPIYYPSPPASFAGTSMYPGMPPAYGGPPV